MAPGPHDRSHVIVYTRTHAPRQRGDAYVTGASECAAHVQSTQRQQAHCRRPSHERQLPLPLMRLVLHLQPRVEEAMRNNREAHLRVAAQPLRNDGAGGHATKLSQYNCVALRCVYYSQ